MTITVVYDCLSLRGQSTQVTKEYECPDFEDISNDVHELVQKFVGLSAQQKQRLSKTIRHTTTVAEQVDAFVESLDKTDILSSYDVALIVDWKIFMTKSLSIKQPKKAIEKSDLVFEYMCDNIENAEVRANFEATYTKIEKDIRDLTVEKQVHIVFSTMGVAYEAIINALTPIAEWSRAHDKRQLLKGENTALIQNQ